MPQVLLDGICWLCDLFGSIGKTKEKNLLVQVTTQNKPIK